jgi:hypothetical protein
MGSYAMWKLAESEAVMTELEKMQSWILSYPHWGDGPLYINYNDGLPGSGGLYPMGLETFSSEADVLGNRRMRCRFRFVLYRIASGQHSDPEGAQWLLDFQKWVQRESLAGKTPKFGDEPETEQLGTEDGMCDQILRSGARRYKLTLIAEFEKRSQAI